MCTSINFEATKAKQSPKEGDVISAHAPLGLLTEHLTFRKC